MDELIIRLLNGDASASEEERVRQWRAEAPENEAHFKSVSGIWSATERASRAVPEAPADVESILAAAEELRLSGEVEDGETAVQDDAVVLPLRSRPELRVRGLLSPSWGLALAAGIAALVAGYQLLATGGFGPRSMASFEAGEAAPRTLTLEDGSLVRLAAGSSLEQWAFESERRVTLNGRAFFAVAHDTLRPFVVETAIATTTVLGTRFEVREEDASQRTVVVDGLVSVASDDGSARVPAGSVARVASGFAPDVVEAEDVYALLDWPEGMLIFQATPLSQVAEEVSRHFGLPVYVADDRLAGLGITAGFDDETFAEIVEALCDVAGAPCAIGDERATIGLPD